MIEIAYLADFPQFTQTVAEWEFEQWGRQRPDSTLERYLTRIQGELNRDSMPVNLLALSEGQPAGTATLRERDMEAHPEMNPWLGSVYVAVHFRQQGIGSALVLAVEDLARRFGIPRLYLFTPNQEHFYARLGWQVHSRALHRDKPVVIMTKDLA